MSTTVLRNVILSGGGAASAGQHAGLWRGPSVLRRAYPRCEYFGGSRPEAAHPTASKAPQRQTAAIPTGRSDEQPMAAAKAP
eukprot:scaffold53411_cov61-Phaeocystis_antarctica.AAC.4